MKRSFREQKNRYKNMAKTDHRKITTLNNRQCLNNKGVFNTRKARNKPKLASKMAKNPPLKEING